MHGSHGTHTACQEVAAATRGAVASHSEVFGVLRWMTQSTDRVCSCLSVARWLEANVPDVVDQMFASSAELDTAAVTTGSLIPRPRHSFCFHLEIFVHCSWLSNFLTVE